MNIVFFDILNKHNKKLYKIKEYKGKKYIYLNRKILNNFMYKFVIKLYLKTLIKDKVFCIFSKEFNRNIIKDFVYDILKDKLQVLDIINTKFENSLKYLENFNLNDRLLLIVDNNFDINNVKKYIFKFKYIDILNIYNNKLNIENINIEYGSNINVINTKDLTKYNIYVIFTKIKLSNYMLNKSSFLLDLLDYEDDIYTKEYETYSLYKNDFLEVNRYSKCKLGKFIIILKEMRNYGKEIYDD